MGVPRQEYWSGVPFPPPGDLPNPRIEPVSPALADGFFITVPPGKPRWKVELTAAEQCWRSLALALSCRLAAWRISAGLFFYHTDLEHGAEMIFFPLHHCLLQSITLALMNVFF